MIKQAEAEDFYDRHNVGYVKIDCNWLLSQNFNLWYNKMKIACDTLVETTTDLID